MKHRYSISMLALICLLMCSACTRPPQFSDAEIKRIAETQEHYRQAWLANESTGVLNTLTDDVILMPPGPNAKKVVGKKAVSKFWFPKADTVYIITKFEIGAPEIYGDGDYACFISTSYLSWDTVAKDSVLAQSSSKSEFISSMKKDNGQWKIYRQMWNVKAND